MDQAIISLKDTSLGLFTLVVVIISVVLSATIGLEREFNGHAAGLRTHIIIALSSTFVGVLSSESANSMVICAGALIALGFISAGSVVQTGKDVRGITTSSTIMLAGLIGLACGLGYVLEGIIISVVGVLLLICLSFFERKTSKSNPIVTLMVDPKSTIADDIVKLSTTYGLKIINISSKIINFRGQDSLKVVVTFTRCPSPTIHAFADELSGIVSPLKIDVKTPRGQIF